MSESKNNNKKTLDTIYVFSENNKVYVKGITFSKISDNNSVNKEEWFPINFQWRASIGIKNIKLHTTDENQQS
ncbi:hypothetical protein [Aquimarina muelleri]|uniref:Uncharacterized protein n=1 Tax=Aquimarina muelleri TaxID=279356 RepID=A0A918JXE0_9FLAO|nr:hypothetical protein [Aquimarina muelleri]MCX2763359.1 hypothetical protein [Aquimarina muelleri]GGX28495.1 hypothetical protein GCM10007384_32120 [Aquimarina muelleri]